MHAIVEPALVSNHPALAVLVIGYPDQAVGLAAMRHVDDRQLLARFGIEDVDAALPVAGRPHLPAVRRQQYVVCLVTGKDRIEDAPAGGFHNRYGAPELAAGLALVGNPDLGLVGIQRAAVRTDPRRGRPLDGTRGQIDLGDVVRDRRRHVHVFASGINDHPVAAVPRVGVLRHDFPVGRVHLGHPVGSEGGHATGGKAARIGAGRLHQHVNELAVGKRRVVASAQILTPNPPDNLVRLGIEEKHVESVGVAGEHVEQQVAVLENLPMMQPPADIQVFDGLQRQGVHLQ